MKIGIYANWSIKVSSDGFYILSTHKKYLDAFCRLGEQVILLSNLSATEPSEHDEYVSFDNVQVIQLPPFGSYLASIRFFSNIFRGVRKLSLSSDFVYIRSPEPFAWLFALMQPKGCTLHYHFVSNPLEVLIAQRSSLFLVRLAKLIIYYPEYLLNAIAAYFTRSSCNGPSMVGKLPRFLRRRTKVVVESSLVDTDFVDSKNLSVSSSGPVRLLSVGRLKLGKGTDVLLYACKILAEERPDVCFSLTIVGDGSERHQLELLVTRLGLSRHVTFLGEVKNGPPLNSIYSDHDLFIMPSLSETGPRVILEAMARNLFCVSTNVGYVPVVIGAQNQRGIIVAPGSSEAIKEAIIWYYSNRDVANQMVLLARQEVNKYTLDRFVAAVFE